MTNLEMLRAQFKWSRKELAELIGHNLTVRMIYGYEREGVNPNIEILLAFAEKFHVSIDFLLGRTEENKPIVNFNANCNVARFGERIREYRIQNNLDKKEIAKAAGITATYLSAIENKGKIPKLETAAKILNALHLSADYALMDALVTSAPIKSSMVQDLLISLSPEKRTFALNMLESIIKSL